MNYADIKIADVANGQGVRVSLFVSGCTHHCKGCFNSQAWDFNYGNEFTEQDTERIVNELKHPYVSGLSLLGGEPLEYKNQQGLLPLLKRIKKELPEKDIWCYTGYRFDKDIVSNMFENWSETKELMPVNFKYKARIFEMLYSDKKELLDLYNAVNGTAYDNPEELEALFLNINPGYNENLKSVCKSLSDYAEYTSRVRRYAKERPIEEAVEKAITECIQEGFLVKFLSEHRAEAKKVSIYEYDQEKHLRMERRDAKAEGRNELLEELVKKKLQKNKSPEIIAEELEEDISVIENIIMKITP